MSKIFSGLHWVSGTDTEEEGVWRNPATENLLTFLHSHWNDGQPNSSGGNEDCLVVFQDGFGDAQCTEQEAHPVCEAQCRSNSFQSHLCSDIYMYTVRVCSCTICTALIQIMFISLCNDSRRSMFKRRSLRQLRMRLQLWLLWRLLPRFKTHNMLTKSSCFAGNSFYAMNYFADEIPSDSSCGFGLTGNNCDVLERKQVSRSSTMACCSCAYSTLSSCNNVF